MARLPGDRGVQYSGCWALGSLAEDSPANGAAIRQAGGVAALTAAMDGPLVGVDWATYGWDRDECQAALDAIPAEPCAGAGCSTAAHAPPPAPDDSCPSANDGYCDEPYECPTGTDATDCSEAGFENGNNRYCQYVGDGECDEGPHGTPGAYCPPGSDTVDCCVGGVPRAHDSRLRNITSANVCCGAGCAPPGPDWCQHANDGDCDEPPIGYECPVGSDTTDCAAAATQGCRYHDDGECDEGPEAQYCLPGTDTADCCEDGKPKEWAEGSPNFGRDLSNAICDGPPPATATPEPAPQPELVRDDSCATANDDECDEPYECDPGTDSTDCDAAGYKEGNNPYCRYVGDGECDEGPHGTPGAYCAPGSDTVDCCSGGMPRGADFKNRPIDPENVCCGGDCVLGPDWCQFANDGHCDECSGECPAGTDTTDCADVDCATQECQYHDDGECDEKTEGGWCLPGTDTADCCDENGEVKVWPATDADGSANPDAGQPVADAADCSSVVATPTEQQPAPQAGNDSCPSANDGYCDEPYECPTGTDATDCSEAGFENGNNRYCQYTGDGECDEGPHGTPGAYCPPGSDTHDCCVDGVPRAREPGDRGQDIVAANVCCGDSCAPGPDWCQYAQDGHCDEPPVGYECPVGSDTTDCAAAATQECQYHDDGDCDEGPEAQYCLPGTDTADCCEDGKLKEWAEDSPNFGRDLSNAICDGPPPAPAAISDTESCGPPDGSAPGAWAHDGECDERELSPLLPPHPRLICPCVPSQRNTVPRALTRPIARTRPRPHQGHTARTRTTANVTRSRPARLAPTQRTAALEHRSESTRVAPR
eukprot:COSAG04_NODE_30_length_35898_cov_42.288053_7_plen_823_part_00